MNKVSIICVSFFILSCSSQKYFIVRHAEKDSAVMSGNPKLSAEGEKQARDLMLYLQNQKIKHIYSTNFIRTLSTAEPLSKALSVPVKQYDPSKQSDLINALKNIKNDNVLVVGHSNTLDDVVDGLMGKETMQDLPETEYGFIYLVKRKGEKYTFEKIPFRRTTN